MPLGWHWWRAPFSTDPVDAAAVCVAGVALGHIHLHFTWQAWHLVTSTFLLRGKRGTVATGLAHTTLRGRRGTWRHPLSLHTHPPSHGSSGSARSRSRSSLDRRQIRIYGYDASDRVLAFLVVLFFCLCSNAATSFTIPMAHQARQGVGIDHHWIADR